MAELPSDHLSRGLFDDLADPVDPAADAAARARLLRWVFAGLTAAAVLGVAAALIVPTWVARDRERRAAVAAAVGRYAEIYDEPASRVYRLCTIEAVPQGGGAWKVEVSRVLVPDPKAGYQISLTFLVDRGGRVEYLGRTEGRK